MKSEVFQRLGSIPAIVHIVLTEATRRRAAREITDAVFENQIQRITREELTPKGLKLLMREMPGGRTRFIIKKQATGVVFDLLNFDADGALEPDSAMLLEPEASPA